MENGFIDIIEEIFEAILEKKKDKLNNQAYVSQPGLAKTV